MSCYKEFIEKVDSALSVNTVLVYLKEGIDKVQLDIMDFFSSTGNGSKIEELYKYDDTSSIKVPRIPNLRIIANTYNQYISGMEVFIEQEFSNVENNENEVISKVKNFSEKDDTFVPSLFTNEGNLSVDINFKDALGMLEVLIDFREHVNDFYNYAVKFHNMVVSKDSNNNTAATALIKFFAKSVLNYSCELITNERNLIDAVQATVDKPNEVVSRFREIHKDANGVSMNKPTGLQLL